MTSRWQFDALCFIRSRVDAGERVTSDDVRYELGDPPTPNMMGAVFRDAHKMGLIVQVGTARAKHAPRKSGLILQWGAPTDTPQGSLL
jgi:hypothetical protein